MIHGVLKFEERSVRPNSGASLFLRSTAIQGATSALALEAIVAGDTSNLRRGALQLVKVTLRST